MAVNPSTGSLYLSNSRGDVLEYAANQPGASVSILLSGEQGLVRDYFGTYDPAAAGSMGFHWRQVCQSECVAWAASAACEHFVALHERDASLTFRPSMPTHP